MLLFLSWIGYRALARGRSSVNFGVLAFLFSFFGIAGSLFTRTTRIWRRSTPSSPSWSANAVESSRSFGQDMVNMLYTLTRNCLMRSGCLRNSILSNYLRVLTTGNRSGWCFVGTGRFCVVLSLANKLVVLGIDTLSMKTVDLEVYLAAFLFRPSGISDYYCEFGIELHLSFVRSMLASSIISMSLNLKLSKISRGMHGAGQGALFIETSTPCKNVEKQLKRWKVMSCHYFTPIISQFSGSWLSQDLSRSSCWFKCLLLCSLCSLNYLMKTYLFILIGSLSMLNFSLCCLLLDSPWDSDHVY